MRTILASLMLALLPPVLRAQVVRTDSAFLLEQAKLIEASGGRNYQQDAALVRVASVVCSRLSAPDGRSGCFAAMKQALEPLLIQLGPCTKDVRVNREGKRECWRLMNGTWTWALVLDTDSIPKK